MATNSKGKIGVLIEEHFDPFEFRSFNEYFPQQGYQVEYISHLWGNKAITFHANSEDGVIKEQVTVTTEVNDINPADYKAIICIGAYAMDRLRYEVNVRKGEPNQAPAVVFIRQAMQEPNVKIGVICHGLWLLCAADILENRRVTCAHNILVDVENAGADIIYENDLAADIVIDENLVTGRHPDLVYKFMETLVREVENKQRSLHAAMTV
ncbi:MAG TPA: DJ-1/PfpI family protein [Nostocaceae cyanobacterium]|nr:DJ-1/PfpI family protein [Nostocaceae cyanobacterium]